MLPANEREPVEVTHIYRPDVARQARTLRRLLDIPEPSTCVVTQEITQDNQSAKRRGKGRQT
jgi:hypothetical protein